MHRKALAGGGLVIALLTLLGIAAAGSAGYELEGKMVKKRPFSFFLPAKWHTPFLYGFTRERVRGERELIYTKDGFALDVIQFRSRPIKKPFEHTKKLLTKDMAPFEMAQLVINDLELDKQLQGLTIHENKPVTVCGRPGFRVVFSYLDNGNLSYKSVYYGFQRQNIYYTIRYEAPLIHYFDTYLPAFEKMITSASLTVRDGNWDDDKDFDPDPEPEGEGY